MRSRQLYASITASIAGTVYFDIPDDTTVRAVTWSIVPTVVNASDYLIAEVSLSSSNQTLTNDAQGVISSCCMGSFAIGGTGAAQVGHTVGTLANCPLKAGTRLYLNATESGSGTWSVRALVWYD